MQTTTKKWNHAVALLAIIGLVISTAALAKGREPASPIERLKAISPLLDSAISDPDTYKEALQGHSQETGISEARLELWLNLFLSHGKRGLQATTPASAVELARMIEGTWEMNYRVVDGVTEQVDSWQFNNIVSQGNGSVKLESMTLEEGILAPSICDQTLGCPFVLGAYGTAVYQDVTGAEYGLAPGEVGVLMQFDGHLSGDGYPGFESDVRGHVRALWVKQGNLYRTASFKHSFEPMSTNLDDLPIIPQIIHFIQDLLPPYSNDAVIELGTGTQTIEYEAQESFEQQALDSPSVAVWDLEQYWEAAVRDHRYLSPTVARQATSPTAAAHAATVHAGQKAMVR